MKFKKKNNNNKGPEKPILIKQAREFPGRPVIRTPCFHCWGLGPNPGQEPKDPVS